MNVWIEVVLCNAKICGLKDSVLGSLFAKSLELHHSAISSRSLVNGKLICGKFLSSLSRFLLNFASNLIIVGFSELSIFSQWLGNYFSSSRFAKRSWKVKMKGLKS